MKTLKRKRKRRKGEQKVVGRSVFNHHNTYLAKLITRFKRATSATRLDWSTIFVCTAQHWSLSRAEFVLHNSCLLIVGLSEFVRHNSEHELRYICFAFSPGVPWRNSHSLYVSEMWVCVMERECFGSCASHGGNCGLSVRYPFEGPAVVQHITTWDAGNDAGIAWRQWDYVLLQTCLYH